MSNFKFNTTADIINHFRTIIRTDIDPNCSKSLSDFKFTDLENPDLRVLTGGSYYTSTNLTNTNSATTVSVPSSYLISNVLNTQFNGPIDWPVGAFPIRDGAASNWYAAKANNYTSMSTSANMEITMTWDSAYTLTAYSGSTLLFTCKDCPQIMLDLQAPGGAGADGYGWRSSVYNYRGYSGGGGGGGAFATIVFNKDCKGVKITQDSSGTISCSVGASFENSIGYITAGSNGNGRTGGAGGTTNIWGGTGVYIINNITGGDGGNGYTESTWIDSDITLNDQYGSKGFDVANEYGGVYISLSPRIVDGSPYMRVGNAGDHQRTTRMGSYNLYPGGGGGGSVMGEGGIGQRCSTNTYYVATSGGIGAGGGGGCTHVSSNGYNTKAAAGGTGKIIFYFPGP